MKNKLLLMILFFAIFLSTAHAQTETDTTNAPKKFQSGLAIYAEFGLLSNNSFKTIRDQMRALNIKPFESLMSSIVLAKRMETDKFFADSRLILMNSTKPNHDDNVSKGMFRGIGIGVDASPKFVNSTHWNVLVPIGWDLMLYQLKVKQDQNASFSQVVANPNGYRSVKLYTGSFNLHAGIGVDYKMNLFPKVYDKVYISSKVTYHLPVFRMGKWKGDDVKVDDLASFKPNQLYAQIGLVFFPKYGPGMHGMSGMHGRHGMWGRMNKK